MSQKKFMLKLIKKFNSLLTILITILLFKTNIGYSHAILEYSEPGRRAILYRPPTRIILTFNEKIEENFARIKVFDNKDRLVIDNDNVINLEEDKKSIFIDIPILSNGIYFIQYEVISVDGHKVKGRYKFIIKEN